MLLMKDAIFENQRQHHHHLHNLYLYSFIWASKWQPRWSIQISTSALKLYIYFRFLQTGFFVWTLESGWGTLCTTYCSFQGRDEVMICEYNFACKAFRKRPVSQWTEPKLKSFGILMAIHREKFKAQSWILNMGILNIGMRILIAGHRTFSSLGSPCATVPQSKGNLPMTYMKTTGKANAYDSSHESCACQILAVFRSTFRLAYRRNVLPRINYSLMCTRVTLWKRPRRKKMLFSYSGNTS